MSILNSGNSCLPVAGILRNKLGNLTSAVALRLTLMGMLSKNERKRFTYSEGLKRICEMVLSILDRAGVYRTSAADRDIDIIFPSPLPENTMEKLKEARIKKELGVSNDTLTPEKAREFIERMDEALEMFIGPKGKMMVHEIMMKELRRTAPEHFEQQPLT